MDANANNIEATFDLQTVELQLDSNIQQQNFDALFSINAAGTTWGSIDGDIENQTDLISILNSKATNEALTALATTVTNNYTTLDNKIDGVQSDLSGGISVLNTKVEGYNTALSNRIDTLSGTVSNNYTTLNGKINTNASNITAINNTLAGYGNIVTHNVSEFATSAQGTLANTALQPNDNISKLTNNAGYITLSALNGYATEDFVTSQGYLSSISSSDVTNALGYTPYNATNPNGYISGIDDSDVITALGYTPYDSSNPAGYITASSLPTVNNNTITIQKNSTNIGSFTLNQSSNDTINIVVPTDTNDLTNDAGFITSASLPTLEDLTTTAQLAAINSGATSTNIGQIATNASNISAEVTNRQNADNALQSQIDAIVSASDVFDIVGTYAELQAYDISTVPVNDIIKVLVDSTHSGAATYYRCVENNNVKSWSYIGSEGAYYTKGEADSKFVEQTITINGQPLSSNVTLTASDVNALPSSTTIGAGVLTVQKNGTTINTFGANDTGNTTINITVPTDTSDLTNNAGFITGITGTDVTNALGYTPYDSSNPSGYTSNIGTVTSVNNISPVSGNVTLSIPTATSDLTNDSGFITTSDLTNYVTTNTDQNITGTKTFVGQKKIGFKQSGNSDKLGFTLYTSNNTEKGYLEYNPSNTVDSVPLMTLGNYASSAAALTHVGFRKYSSISGANGAYNLLAPLISDAKSPFNLTTTYTNFYLPLGFTNGTNTVLTAKTGMVDLSSLISGGGGTTYTAGTGIDITSNVISIDTSVVAQLSDISDMATQTWVGNQGYITSSSLPSVMTGATASADGASGLVPQPLTGDQDKYLKGDGTWGTPSGGGGTTYTAGDGIEINNDVISVSQYGSTPITNYTVVGSPTIVSATQAVSGFSNSNYLLTPEINTVSGITSYEIGLSFETTGVSSNNEGLFDRDNTSYGWRITLSSSRNIVVRLTSQGIEYSRITSTNTISTNTRYWIKLVGQSGVGTKLYISTDGENYTEDGSTTIFDNNLTFSTAYRIGNNKTNVPLVNGTMYLGDCYYKINGDLVWKGAETRTGNAVLATPISYGLVRPDSNSILVSNGTLSLNENCLSAYLKNIATGTDSISIAGTASANSNSINIGRYTSANSNGIAIGVGYSNQSVSAGNSSVAIGYGCYCTGSQGVVLGNASHVNSSSYSIAVGYNASAQSSYAVAIGYTALANNTASLAIGSETKAYGNYTIAIGRGANVGTSGSAKNNAIQIGYGTNTTANTLAVGFYGQNSNTPYTLLDGTTGKIPDDRLSSNIARTSDIPDNEMFWVTRESTPYSDIEAALDAGRLPIIKYNDKIFIYSYTNASDEFVFVQNAEEGHSTISVDSSDVWDGAVTAYAETDLSNVTNTGKIAIAHNAMPSNTAVDSLTIDYSNPYTAPADGYYYFSGRLTSLNYVTITNDTNSILQRFVNLDSNTGRVFNLLLPVAKGSSVSLATNGTVSDGVLKFYYLIGSESEQS